MARVIGAMGRLDWSSKAAALDQVFGLDRPSHFLRSSRSLLDRQREPQVTRSFRNFLLDPVTRVARCQAIFDAAIGPSHLKLSAAFVPTADAADRMDLFISGMTADDRVCGLAVEAKFGHRLTPNQLGPYRSRAAKRLQAIAREKAIETAPELHLLVVAPSHRPEDREVMDADRRRNQVPAWRLMTWRRFLLRFQAALPERHDDDAFRAFRRLVWDRANDC